MSLTWKNKYEHKSIKNKLDKILEWRDTGTIDHEESSSLFANVPLINHKQYAKLNVYIGEDYTKVNVFFDLDLSETNKDRVLEFIDTFNTNSNLVASVKNTKFIIKIRENVSVYVSLDELVNELYRCDKELYEITHV